MSTTDDLAPVGQRNGTGAVPVDHAVTTNAATPVGAPARVDVPAGSGGDGAAGPTGTGGTGGIGAPGAGPASPAWSLVRLLAVVAAVVAVFLALGAGDLLLVLALIIVMVMVHELGHFVTAKWAGMKVTQYFVGFGPPLWSIRRGETEYGVKPILAGGYVKIPGMTNLEEIDPADEPRTYRQQPFHKRIIVASAGSFMHLVMAFVLAWIAVIAFGVPLAASPDAAIGGFARWQGVAATPAQLAGLRVGDVVDSVNGHRLANPSQLQHTISTSAGQPITLGVLRQGRQIALRVTPRDALGLRSNGQPVLPPGSGPRGLIGVELTAPPATSEGPVRAVGTAVNYLGYVTSQTVTGLGHVFSFNGLHGLYTQVTNSHAAARAAANPTSSGGRVMSIVGAVRVATQADQAGLLYLIEILIALNIVIGIVNMLPMLPLDGGHVAIAVYERIRTRRGGPRYQADAAKLLPVVYAFVALLLVVVTSAVFLDIAHPTANPFH